MAELDLMKTVNAAVAAAANVAAADPANNLKRSDVPKMVEVGIEAARPIIHEAQARYDYATDNENPFASWGLNASVLAGISGAYGMVEALWDGFQPTDDKTAIITGIASIGAGIMYLIGRYRGKPIGS